MMIKCIVTDDEPIARKGICDYINKIDFLSLIGECEDAISLNNLLKAQQPDLLFLDIEMPYLSGLELLSSIQKNNYYFRIREICSQRIRIGCG